jgi:hypothetical protein
LLRRHIGRRAGANIPELHFLRQHRQAEIGDAHLAAAVDHDVGRLQIAMQHAAIVRGR